MTPGFPVFALDQPDALSNHLRDLGLLAEGEEITSMERAGEGNMNLVVRVRTSLGSYIFKQSRPWVEKYPQIAAPADRMHTEVAFYEVVGSVQPVSRRMPRLLHVDRATRSAWYQDLGPSTDATDMYAGQAMDLPPLVSWLTALHSVPVPDARRASLLNHEMRQLNHAHIFDLPMSGAHGMDLDTITPGLEQAARDFRADPGLQQRVAELGKIYLADGKTLLHGDFYPGSWLRTSDGPMVIDPEFCFLGPPEFDLGVLKAHLVLAGLTPDQAEAEIAGYARPVDAGMIDGFAGVEIMRRLMGVAQLPMERTMAQKQALLTTAAGMIR